MKQENDAGRRTHADSGLAPDIQPETTGRWGLDLAVLPSLLRGPVRLLFGQPPARFAILVATYMFCLYLISNSIYGCLLKVYYGAEQPFWVERHGRGDLDHVILAVCCAPLLEPLYQQLVPALVLSVFTLRGWTVVGLMGGLFALMHGARSIYTLAGMGALGLLLGMTFVYWLRRSWWTAYWVTALAHGLYNASVNLFCYLMWG